MAELANPRWERFAEATAKGMTRADAFYYAGFRAGNKRAAQNRGSTLFGRPEIKARVTEIEEELRQQGINESGITRGYVLAELKRNHEKATQAEAVLDREGNETGEYKYQGTVANRALELMGKELGMFADKLQLENLDSELEAMTPTELKNYVRAMAGEVGLRVVDMNEDQIREYILTQAPRVGLRVEESGEGADRPADAEGEAVQPISEAEAVPRSRCH